MLSVITTSWLAVDLRLAWNVGKSAEARSYGLLEGCQHKHTANVASVCMSRPLYPPSLHEMMLKRTIRERSGGDL